MRKTRVRVPIEDRVMIEDRLANGESLRAVSKSYGICFQSLQYWRKKWGCEPLKICRTRGASHPNWKGGVTIDRQGYRLIYAPERVKAHPYTYEHILIVEKAIGRRLKRFEHVHHLNGDKLDNRLENLIVCSPSHHRTLHRRLETLAMELVRKGDIVFRDGTYNWA